MDLKDEILNTARELSEKGSFAGPSLRKLQNILYRIETSDAHIRFLSFFLFSLIDDLYFNLSGDFPYEEKSNQIIDNIFKEIGNSLLELNKEEKVTLIVVTHSAILAENMANVYALKDGRLVKE